MDIKTLKTEINEINEINEIKSDRFGFDNICDLNLSNIALGTHHKTGTVLIVWNFRKYIINYYKQQCPNHNVGEILKFICLSLYETNNIIKMSNPYHISLIHSIREPVDTILSGFNYHVINMREIWLHRPLLQWINKQLYILNRSPNNIKAKNLYLNAKTVYNAINSIKNIYNITNNKTIYEIYNILNDNNKQYGLYVEYQRYINCEFPDIISVYNRINEINNNNNKYIHAKNFRLENFKHYYKQTCYQVMDVLGIKNESDRANLYETMKKSGNIKKNSHATQGSYNKTEQIYLLLTKDIKQCLHIKNMTIALNYLWQYTQFC